MRHSRWGSRAAANAMFRLLVGISFVSAAGAVFRVIEAHLSRAAASPVAIPPREGPVDSRSMSQIASLISSTAQEHVLLVLLDPTTADAAVAAKQSLALAGGSAATRVSLVFWTKRAGASESRFELVLALECARRQGAVIGMLGVLVARRSALLPWQEMAREAGIHDVSGFLDCFRRRESAPEASDAALLAKRLRLDASPSFVIDSTVIRGPISVDSLKSRMWRL